MKKLTNKERCKKCIHKKVCEYQSYFINIEGIDRCNNYSPKTNKTNKGYIKQSEGEWTISKVGDGGKVRTCSNCHISQTVNVYKNKVMFAYCPYCGAKMKGGE